MFNNRLEGIKYLVATHAVILEFLTLQIGTGLNLNIQRIIFSKIKRMNDGKEKKLDDSEIRQIGGRAGRYKTNGYISAFTEKDLKYIRKAISKQNEILDETNNQRQPL